MSYHVYTTEGIILKRKVFGEADTLLFVLTKDLGLISASARASRLQVSKLKGSLQEYQNITVSCVKGKNGWKITNVGDQGSFFTDLTESSQKILAKVSDLLLKMITGELHHPEVFDTVKQGFIFLKNIKEEDLPSFEIVLVLRILYELGYVAKEEKIDFLLENPLVWSEDILAKAEGFKKDILSTINNAIRQSHL